MENLQNFISKLEPAIEATSDKLNKQILPEMQENYNIQVTAIKAIKSILLKKRLIQDDPYKYDEKIKDIEVPENTNFPESEKAAKIGVRLSKYEMMLDYLTSYYQFNTNFLDPKKISNLVNFSKCFLWSEFTNTSNDTNTKNLADIIQSVLSGPDKMSSGLLRDSLSHLAKTNQHITHTLNQLSKFNREKYKLEVRKNIVGKIEVSEEDLTNPSKVLKDIKKIMYSNDKTQPFYTDLVLETIKDDFSPESAQRHQKILKNLELNSNEKKEVKQAVNYRLILLDGFKLLGNSGTHFNEALTKIKYNDEIIYKQKLTPFKKLLLALRQALNIAEKEKEITISVVNPITQERHRQKISYNKFINDLSKKTVLFKNIANPSSPVQQKIKKFTEEVLLDNLTKHLSESNELLKQMAGLDEFYKTINPELRGKIKGIKIEITTITNYLLKANQCRAEYTTSLEEEEQMKKLGLV